MLLKNKDKIYTSCLNAAQSLIQTLITDIFFQNFLSISVVAS